MEPIHIISLGAGVQSSTMALMAALGELTPMPLAAIFADTQSEPKAVYEWLDWLEKQLPFPVHRVSDGNLGEEIASKRPTGKFRKVDIPAFVKVDGRIGGLINRSCTRDFKITPIRRKARELCGLTGKRSPETAAVIQWIGISRDEARRIKPSREAWCENRWPLIEAGKSRGDCLEWMKRHGFPKPPKSSCTFCPYHSDSQWAALTPEEFETAAKIDDLLRFHPPEEYRSKGELYLHRSGKPLREVVFKTDFTYGQLNFFHAECEGMCGV